MSDTNTFDVIIAGYGPTGATLANLLGQAGHRVAVIDMFTKVFDQPRAINIDQEVLRTWQSVGLADQIAAGCEPHTGTDFVGIDGELIKYIYSAPPPYPLGWPANLMFVQPDAEQTLRQGVRRFDSVTEFLACEVTAIEQDDQGVTVTIADPTNRITQLHAAWAVGCDGANSFVRRSLGIGQEDLGFSEWWIVVDAWLRADTPLPQRTTQYCYPDKPAAYVRCSGALRRWEMKILPGEDPESYRDIDKVADRMSAYVNPHALEFWRSAVYNFHARVTDTWRQGRVLLAGDAAHQMPPFLGQGLCSGVRDASNLAWKLDRVLRSQSTDALLDTYEIERKPHIRVLTDITKSLGEIVGETDRPRAEARDARLREDMRSGRMETVRQNLIPPLNDGFFDTEDPSGLAGSLAVQPLLTAESGTVLSDDIAPRSWQLLTATQTSELIANPHLTVVAIGECGEYSDVEDSFSAYIAAHGVQSLLVRPDGYIWGAYSTPQATLAAARRLITALNTTEGVA